MPRFTTTAQRQLGALTVLWGLWGCPGNNRPDPKSVKDGEIHYDLGVDAMEHNNVRSAIKEFEQAQQLNPENERAENALGILYHLSFHRLDQAELHYKKALLLKPKFSEAKLNLGNLYLDQARYDDAITLYEEVLGDLYYAKGFLAVGNEGWAYYKKGDSARGLELIQESVRSNPEFCQGYRNLGLIRMDQKQFELARSAFDKLTKKCPAMAEGHYQLGQVQLHQGQQEDAKKSFAQCRDLSREGEPLQEACAKLAGDKS
jgi:tetratricopeptide (TPR) repeat protein